MKKNSILTLSMNVVLLGFIAQVPLTFSMFLFSYMSNFLLTLNCLFKCRHIPKVWELTGTRYQDAKLAKQTASALLSMNVNSMPPEYWRCKTCKGA